MLLNRQIAILYLYIEIWHNFINIYGFYVSFGSHQTWCHRKRRWLKGFPPLFFFCNDANEKGIILQDDVIPLFFMLTLRKTTTLYSLSSIAKKNRLNLPHNNLSIYSIIEKQHFKQGICVWTRNSDWIHFRIKWFLLYFL